jgi:mannose-1-phosphate guanylyltransferase/mannose-1-phosphate guanylyltransferase/mannose-6-phosphate isomerase
LAALAIERDPEEVMVVLPADHLVADEAGFRSVLAHAADLALGAFGIDSPIVTLGAQPTGPATQYGYLVPDLEHAGAGSTASYVLRAFVEKPEPARAEQLIAQPGVSWNAGIFLAGRRGWLAALARHS